MALLAYDGASAFDLNAAKQHSGIAITGYLVGHPGGFNPIDKARVNQIRAMGMGFLPNWERGADYLVSCGKAGGIGAGQEALAAMRALGVPDNGTVACPFSWDVNVNPGLYPQCGQVADGIIAGLAGHYLFSTYGQGGLIDYFRATGRMKVKGWLSGSTSFPGFNASGPNIAMVQSHDAAGNWINTQVPGTDVNTVIDPRALGAWWPAGSPYIGEQPVTPAEIQAIANAVWDAQIHATAPDDKTPTSANHAASTWLTGLNTAAATIKTIAAAEAAQSAALAALAGKANLTPEQLTQIVNDAVKNAVVDVNVTVHDAIPGVTP